MIQKKTLKEAIKNPEIISVRGRTYPHSIFNEQRTNR